MKKLSLLIAAVCMLVTATVAEAIDVKTRGVWVFTYGGLSTGTKKLNLRPKGENGFYGDKFLAAQRARIRFDFVASPTLEAVLHFEFGKFDWGNADDGLGRLDADYTGGNKIKSAYMQWKPVADLTTRMGIQGIVLPGAAVGSPIMDGDVAGISANYKVNDIFGITGFWIRPHDLNIGDSGVRQADEMDVFAITFPIKPQGFEITPWAAFATIGNSSKYMYWLADNSCGQGSRAGSANRWAYNFPRNSWDATNAAFAFGDVAGKTSQAYWGGLAFEMDLTDPLIVKGDIMYGSLRGKGHDSSNVNSMPDASGWWLDGSVEYKTKWGIPGIFGWYSTGDKGKDVKKAKFGRIPLINNDEGPSQISRYTFNNGYGLRGDTAAFTSGVGTWGIGARINKISFIEKLHHDIQVTYYRGTNSAAAGRWHQNRGDLLGRPFLGHDFNGLYMTTKDALYEVLLTSIYQITKELEVGLELGYLYLSMSDDVWEKRAGAGDLAATSNSWKVYLTFKYRY